jgi:hypothetical protein
LAPAGRHRPQHFRQRALQTADAAGHSKDFIAVEEGRDIGADCFDHPHKIDTQDCRQRLASVTGLPGTDFQIERIDALALIRTRASADPGSGRAIAAIRNGAPWLSRTAACVVLDAVLVRPFLL